MFRRESNRDIELDASRIDVRTVVAIVFEPSQKATTRNRLFLEHVLQNKNTSLPFRDREEEHISSERV